MENRFTTKIQEVVHDSYSQNSITFPKSLIKLMEWKKGDTIQFNYDKKLGKLYLTKIGGKKL